jgi:glucokinase
MTQTVGVDVSGATARAVTVADDGQVSGGAPVSGPDAMGALKAALAGVKRSSDLTLGVATDDPQLAAAAPESFPTSGPRPVMCRAGDALASAEAWMGGARGARHAICLWLGDRVLAGVLLDGKPWPGSHGLAGAAAWLALNPVERQDYRKYGSFAAEVNDRGIARRLAWRVQAGDESSVGAGATSLDSIAAADVFAGARSGDGVAISVVRDTARYIAMAAVNLAIALDPEVVVVGGPITSASDLLLDATRQDFERRLPPAMIGQVRCEFSPLGGTAIAIGAARMAMVART